MQAFVWQHGPFFVLVAVLVAVGGVPVTVAVPVGEVRRVGVRVGVGRVPVGVRVGVRQGSL